MARIVTLLVLLVLLAAPAFADVDGFRGMRWGERLDEVARTRPMTLMSSNKADDTVVYTVRDDRLWLGPARLEEIRYTFWKGRLYTVFLGTRGYEDFQRIKQVAFERFGAFDQPDPSVEKHYLQGELSLAGLRFDPKSGAGSLLLISRMLHDLKQQIDRELIRQGAEADF